MNELLLVFEGYQLLISANYSRILLRVFIFPFYLIMFRKKLL